MIRTDGARTIAHYARIPAKEVDFRLLCDESIGILYAISDEAVAWVDEYLPANALRWGSGYVIEHRYVGPILEGIAADGLVVGRR